MKTLKAVSTALLSSISFHLSCLMSDIYILICLCSSSHLWEGEENLMTRQAWRALNGVRGRWRLVTFSQALYTPLYEGRLVSSHAFPNIFVRHASERGFISSLSPKFLLQHAGEKNTAHNAAQIISFCLCEAVSCYCQWKKAADIIILSDRGREASLRHACCSCHLQRHRLHLTCLPRHQCVARRVLLPKFAEAARSLPAWGK